MHNQIRGCVRINASGKNLYKFINMIHCGHIYCFKQYVKNDVFYAEIYRHDLKKVIEFSERCGIELKSAEYKTLSEMLIRYRKRIGIFIGAVIVLAASVYFSNIIVTIDIQGNTNVSDRVILAALEELDIKKGSFIKDLNLKQCENELRIMVDGISWASIRHTGNRVVVEVTEIVEKPDMVLKRMPCNVVAAKSAQITYTSVYDGQLMRIVGDYVQQGDMLVSGVIEDEHGHVTKHHAMGEITGIYEETVTFSHDFTAESRIMTGETENEKYLGLLSLKIPLFIGKSKLNDPVSETSERQLSLFGKKLPISIINEKLNETKVTETEYTESEIEELLMEKIYLYEMNFLNDINILEREITADKNENSLTYTVKYTLEGDIGMQQEIFIK